ncbi:hypothetical protein AAFN60_19100 [Roseibacillus persicicus]|uniref:hypothetical protein n=1 Tax=Roseibacillus persicicus TaxID=454148 RepID=UPI00398AA7F5
MARSLEAEGSPAPFLESALREKKRLKGKGIQSFPVNFTEERVSKVLASWKGIEGPLKLREFTKASGRDIRYGIQGHWQKTIPELVADEAGLNAVEKKRYETLLRKEKFQREDFPIMEAFYSKEWDKLTQQGRDQVSRRLELGIVETDRQLEPPEKLKKGTLFAETLRQYDERMREDFRAGKAFSLKANDLKLILVRGATQERPKEGGKTWYYQDTKNCYQRIHGGLEARKTKVVELMPSDAAQKVNATLDEVVELLFVAAHSEFIGRLQERK